MQLGIFNSEGSVHKKGHTKGFFDEDIPWNNVFQILKRKKYYRKFLDFTTSKFIDDC